MTSHLTRCQVEFLILVSESSDESWKPPKGISFLPSSTLGRDVYFSPAHAVITLQSLVRLGLIEPYLDAIRPRGDYAPAKRYRVPRESDTHRFWCWCRVTDSGQSLVNAWRESGEWPVPLGCLNDMQS